MKKVMMFLNFSLLVLTFALANDSHLNAATLEIAGWVADSVKITCVGKGLYRCSLEPTKHSDLTTSVAESILGTPLPSGATPIVLKKDGGWGEVVDGESSVFPEQYYTGHDDPDFLEVISGYWPDIPYLMPEQIIVYSTYFDGYIGYYLNP